jgi:flagellar biosynthesis protein FlhG
MLDQAFKLRELIQSSEPASSAAPTGPPMVVVTGGRPGVGASTVAVNLAAVLTDFGERVVLVDAAEQHSNLADVAGIKTHSKYSLEDVVSGHCRAADALVPGPAGTMLLPGSGASPDPDLSRHAQKRLLAELQTLDKAATLLVVDCGAGLTPRARRFWLRAKLVTLVTTAENSALLDTYTAIKRSAQDSIAADIRVLANQCDRDRISADVYRRLSQASERFLSRAVATLPALPRHVESNGHEARSVPRAWETPNSPFGHAMLWLGRAVSDALQLEETVPAREHDSQAIQSREFSRC